MTDIVTGMPAPVYAIDRVPFASRSTMIEVIAFHLKNHAIVRVEDSARPGAMRLCYEVRPSEAVFRVFDTHGRQIGVFASVAALFDQAEAVTAR